MSLLTFLLLFIQVATARVMPDMLTRAEWGADESYLYIGSDEEITDYSDHVHGTRTLSERELECQRAKREHPEEFTVAHTVTHTPDGRKLRWERSYSKKISQIVVHHTALPVRGDARTPLERVRALYDYHANSNGWGDIGYHFLIDEQGQIYEGRSGGDYVVGGHVYCGNIGTVGIALLGDFDKEQPSQSQMRSLKELTIYLADKYKINLRRSTLFHGRRVNPVSGHEDLISTACPGHHLKSVMSTLRKHMIAGNVGGVIRFPTAVARSRRRVDRTSVRRARRMRTSVARLPRRVTRRLQTSAALKRGQPPFRSAYSSRGVDPSPAIRIRLGFDRGVADLRNTAPITINGVRSAARGVRLLKSGQQCMVQFGRSQKVGEAVSLGSVGGIFTVSNWDTHLNQFRGEIECRVIDGQLVLINVLSMEDYLAGLAEEPDTEPWEKQRAFAIAARSYATHYLHPDNRKFPGMPYDGDDSPARFQKYGGVVFEQSHPRWVQAVRDTAGQVLKVGEDVVKAAYFSSSDGRTRSPAERGWVRYPHAEVFYSKKDPWCSGMELRGHGVGMSGCGAEGQANEGKKAEEILGYYYEGARISGGSGGSER